MSKALKKWKDLDFSEFSRIIAEDSKPFAKDLQRAVDMANKRLKRLPDYNPDKMKLMEAGITRFSARGDLKEKLKTVSKVERFLDSPTSTVTGFNKHIKTLAKNLHDDYGRPIGEKTVRWLYQNIDPSIKDFIRNTALAVTSKVDYQYIVDDYNNSVDYDFYDLDSDADATIEDLERRFWEVKDDINKNMDAMIEQLAQSRGFKIIKKED